MTRFAEVAPRERIAAPVDTVRAQFADLDHHIRRNVQPKLHFDGLRRRVRGVRCVQEVRLPGIRQIRQEVRAASLEDKRDIEALGHTESHAALAGASPSRSKPSSRYAVSGCAGVHAASCAPAR